MKIIFLIACCTLGACSAVTPQFVSIPVATNIHSIEIPKKPYLPIYSLTPMSTSAEIIKSYVASVKLLLDYNHSLRLIIEGQR